jgi:hypothetical protein
MSNLDRIWREKRQKMEDNSPKYEVCMVIMKVNRREVDVALYWVMQSHLDIQPLWYIPKNDKEEKLRAKKRIWGKAESKEKRWRSIIVFTWIYSHELVSRQEEQIR